MVRLKVLNWGGRGWLAARVDGGLRGVRRGTYVGCDGAVGGRASWIRKIGGG